MIKTKAIELYRVVGYGLLLKKKFFYSSADFPFVGVPTNNMLLIINAILEA